eukprot:SAG31_NODE_33371_length_344_cov_1.057143_1_plen_72_part_01
MCSSSSHRGDATTSDGMHRGVAAAAAAAMERRKQHDLMLALTGGLRTVDFSACGHGRGEARGRSRPQSAPVR